jgi:hypothetical protein
VKELVTVVDRLEVKVAELQEERVEETEGERELLLVPHTVALRENEGLEEMHAVPLPVLEPERETDKVPVEQPDVVMLEDSLKEAVPQ